MGALGLAMGRVLARAGWGVRVFDRREAGREASWAAAGMLAAAAETEPGNETFFALEHASRERWGAYAAELETETGEDKNQPFVFLWDKYPTNAFNLYVISTATDTPDPNNLVGGDTYVESGGNSDNNYGGPGHCEQGGEQVLSVKEPLLPVMDEGDEQGGEAQPGERPDQQSEEAQHGAHDDRQVAHERRHGAPRKRRCPFVPDARQYCPTGRTTGCRIVRFSSQV